MLAKYAERTISYASPEDWDSWSNEFKKLAHAYDLWHDQNFQKSETTLDKQIRMIPIVA
ncbi:hypothetical protein FOIG_16870 [Fusarium odoratissimum NRRL 54006]|uniref:Uncharacterized protein n=2 Tax=Fusarium oxysporum species complex TaxID=171631 RepID=X0J0I0_FUSO5|nr:uncharacterized protein FOIG_16870 [Fusarium odoratissimum NRRL 54006]EXL89846.1 hypothetical protein FOIG_16870 [Fusarium odoratissimum NRRL 54006]TXB96940.1 hypothetical protein FocTR4_00012213 [Fusarium oxysporum f. sp. cubense]